VAELNQRIGKMAAWERRVTEDYESCKLELAAVVRQLEVTNDITCAAAMMRHCILSHLLRLQLDVTCCMLHVATVAVCHCHH
jgi:hypothetical protein